MKYISYGLYAISFCFFGLSAILIYPTVVVLFLASLGPQAIPWIETFLSFLYYLPGGAFIQQDLVEGAGIVILLALPIFAFFSGISGGIFFGLGYWTGRNKK